MKKIALIMDGWKRWFTFAWPAGILQRIRQTGEEVSLYIFNSSGGWSCDEEYNTGEYNIYRLPNLREFDGIILDLNNIGYPKVREDVIRRAKESGVPVISIAKEIVDMHGGTISVASDLNGTVFTVKLQVDFDVDKENFGHKNED